MSRIIPIELNQTVDYSNTELEYFIEDSSNSQLTDYQEISFKIQNAKTVKVASTSNLDNQIIDALHNNPEVNIYMIFKSFSTSSNTLARFDKRKPIIAREIRDLDNNFIIIDNIAYLFLNPLSQNRNFVLSLSEQEVKDLDFIFKYYFWNCALMEKLVDNISQPTESPFPPFEQRELETVNIGDLENLGKLYIPRNKSFKNELDISSYENYFSDDLNNVLKIGNNQFQIGNFVIDRNLEITNSWELEKYQQQNIDLNLEIIPKVENWENSIRIENSTNRHLPDMRADKIEDMETTKPESFQKESYINSINFFWNVLPPIKPQNAKKSKLYGQFDRLTQTLHKNLDILENHLNYIVKESDELTSFISFIKSVYNFLGANRKAKQNLKQIEEYRKKNLHIMNIIDVQDFFQNEFQNFYFGIIKSEQDFKEDKKRKEAEEKWLKEKDAKEMLLAKKSNELKNDKVKLSDLEQKTKEKDTLQNQIDEFREKVQNLRKEKQESQSELNHIEKTKKDISICQSNISSFEKMLKLQKEDLITNEQKKQEQQQKQQSESEIAKDKS